LPEDGCVDPHTRTIAEQIEPEFPLPLLARGGCAFGADGGGSITAHSVSSDDVRFSKLSTRMTCNSTMRDVPYLRDRGEALLQNQRICDEGVTNFLHEA